MIIKYDKKHRIKTDKWLNVSVPQWKGRFFWHNYTILRMDVEIGCLALFETLTRKAAFHCLADAREFLQYAIAQENGRPPSGKISYGDTNPPELLYL